MVVYKLCFLLLLITIGYCEGSNWVCYKTKIGNGTLTNELFGDGNIDKGRCGESCSNATSEVQTQVIGYVGVFVAVIFFGTNFIPVKKFDTGDGIFFQWVLCVGIWTVGLVVNLIREQPLFFYPSLIGGFLWTFGNLFTVAIIKMIGLTMGLTVWGVTNLLAGWISGRFIMGQSLGCAGLNYGGVACIILSTIVLAFVKSEGKVTTDQSSGEAPTEKTPLINSAKVSNERSSLSGSLMDKILNRSGGGGEEQDRETLSFSQRRNLVLGTTEDPDDADASIVDRLGVWPKRIIGFSMALYVGFFFGSQFLPVEFMRLCSDGLHSCNELDYVFGHYTGILLSSTLWFVIYCIIKKNKPQVYPKVIVPGLISGIMWGIATVGWFMANQRLSLAISFPIITAGPGFVSSLLGIVVFREIKGWRNIGLYFGGFSISVVGIIMVSLSNCTVHC